MTTELAHDTAQKSQRLAAAQHGADVLLTINGICDVDAYNNSWAWTYLALFPALFIPGNVIDVLFIARTALWGVRNGFLYLSTESEATRGGGEGGRPDQAAGRVAP